MSSSLCEQSHYCENCFVKTSDAMKKHLSICAAKEGITYAIDNGQIVTCDVSFTVCLGFETTTGNSAFSDPKMYVISYCHFYSYHLSLNLDKIAAFRSFQQHLMIFMNSVIIKENTNLFFIERLFGS